MTVQTQVSRLFFTDHLVASTGYVYTEANGNYATSGWIKCKNDYTVVQTCVATRSSAQDITFRIEGKFDGLDRAASILIINEDTKNNIDKLSNITHKVKEIRVGVKMDAMSASITGSPVEVYAGVVLTDMN